MSRSRNHPVIGEAEGKKQDVRAMFNAIAPHYDRLNRILSFGIDQYWRFRTINRLLKHKPSKVIDLATGTADLAIYAAKRGVNHVSGVDISEEMLAVGHQKLEKGNLQQMVSLHVGDAAEIPFEDQTFDAATVAFGVRNFENLSAGLKDIARVLKPGAPLLVLEFSQPTHFPIKQIYGFYSKHILPRIGALLSRDTGAYTYLPESIKVFPAGDAFLAELHKAGYDRTEAIAMTFGVVSLYVGYRRTAGA